MTYFSRITLRKDTLEPRRLAHVVTQDTYQDHRGIWRLFPDRPESNRDFLFRREQWEGSFRYFVLSAQEPSDRDGLWRVETKNFDPKLYQGQVLTFSVRVNPIITRSSEGNHARHDVIMDAKKAKVYTALPISERPSQAELVQTTGLAWLHSRCGRWGFTPLDGSVLADGYQQQCVYKRGGSSPIRFSTLDFTGILRIDNPDLFKEALLHGIGPAKGLGCGLLLVKPVSQ